MERIEQKAGQPCKAQTEGRAVRISQVRKREDENRGRLRSAVKRFMLHSPGLALEAEKTKRGRGGDKQI